MLSVCNHVSVDVMYKPVRYVDVPEQTVDPMLIQGKTVQTQRPAKPADIPHLKKNNSNKRVCDLISADIMRRLLKEDLKLLGHVISIKQSSHGRHRCSGRIQ